MKVMSTNDTTTTTIFEQCIVSVNDNNDNVSDSTLLQCISDTIETQMNHMIELAFPRSILLVFAASLIFFMQAGFAMVCAGAVRKKNVQNTMLKNLLDACGASLAFYATGYAFAFGGTTDPPSIQKTFMGTSNFFLMNVDDLAFWLFQYAFSATSTTIIAGTLAERCQMAAYLCYSVMLSGWVYPIVVHSIWSANGFLSAFAVEPLLGVGMVDFAGSGVVHITGGATALYATIILGPRRGRFHDDTGRKLDIPNKFPGHSVALQMLGTFILWFGWYGFNAGSALYLPNESANILGALAATNSTLAAGTAGITALMINLWYLERTTGEPYFDLVFAMNGALSGLVSITGGCGVVEPWAAVVTGFVGGIVYFLGSYGLEKFRLDDAVDAIPVHLFSGIWGVISVGLFANPTYLLLAHGRDAHPGLIYSWWNGTGSDASLLACQIIGILFIIGWVTVIMLPFFIWLDWKGWFRSDPLEEIVGLDLSYHGGIPLLSGQAGYDDGGVHPEFVTQFRQKREETRLQNPRHSHLNSSTSNFGETDHYNDLRFTSTNNTGKSYKTESLPEDPIDESSNANDIHEHPLSANGSSLLNKM